MLVIRNEQQNILGRVPRIAFEADLANHFFRHYPAECGRAGRDRVLEMVRLGVHRSFGHGYVTQREAGIYINLMVMLGQAFDRDPQIPWALDQLNDLSIDDPFERIKRVFQSTLKYLQRSFGIGNSQMARTLVRVRDFSLDRAPESDGPQLRNDLCAVLQYLCPPKFEFQGDEANRALVEEGVVRAERYRIESGRGATVYVALMFLLGAGFDGDPLYPWAGQILRDPSLRGENARVSALHRAAMDYVGEVLSE